MAAVHEINRREFAPWNWGCVGPRSDGRKKIHTTYPDGAEMVEEYDEKTDVLLVRKVRKPTKVGKEGEWVFEVGQALEGAFDPYSDTLRASSSNPLFLRKDTPEHFQWRIRNLPYPADVYSVSVDHDKQEIVVRTSNKKYYKRHEKISRVSNRCRTIVLRPQAQPAW
ncbi:DPCD [Symbiodinium natans]|uniref:Protein DPCD n=1 Tax=Symbiodinium natans TaxID=878477 RepID=A0A812ICT0_9DINO|nr:DPCD [Symbiodinium natans]